MSKMDKLILVPKGLGAQKSLHNMAKYANYPMDELRIDFYMKMVRTLTRRKPLYVAVVS